MGYRLEVALVYNGPGQQMVRGDRAFELIVVTKDGKEIVTEPYSSQDMMASVLKSLGISLETTFTAANGRPMKIANSGRVIQELFA